MFGIRTIPLIGPASVSNEWYEICMPPECNNNSMRLEFENTFTDDGTHRINLASNAFVIDRKISFEIDTPTDA